MRARSHDRVMRDARQIAAVTLNQTVSWDVVLGRSSLRNILAVNVQYLLL